jgi:hypothetical protein
LDKEETRGYIEHRLRHVGWNGDPTFSPGAIDAIYNFTGGVPRRINTLCNRVMLAGFLTEAHEFRTADIEAVVGELKEEAGLDLAPMPSRGRLTEVGTSPPGAVQPDTPPAARAGVTTGLDTTAVAALDSQTESLQRIEERLFRLEKTMSSALDLLRTLLSRESGGKRGREGSS